MFDRARDPNSQIQAQSIQALSADLAKRLVGSEYFEHTYLFLGTKEVYLRHSRQPEICS